MRFNWHLVHFFAIIPVIFSVSLSQKEQEDIRVKCYSSHTIYSHFQGWTTWSHWSQCSSSSGFGIQKRYRNCYSSFACPVGTSQQRICTTAIHGGWSSWTTHSCSKSCGGGYALMQRSCTNPAPMFGGSACRGQYYKYVACNTHPCQGGWSSWTTHSCSKSCGGGYALMQRSCTNPAPMFGGSACRGQHYKYVACNTHPCQVPMTSTTTTPPPTTIWSTKQPANTTKPIRTTATTVVTTPPTTTTTTTTMPPPTTTSTTTTTTATSTMTTPQTSSTTIRPPLTTTQSTPTTTKKKFFTIRAVIE
ncbi:thrombospondin-1 [Magallana gigas]|uniref:thrombospondin-1 n=1 Tax=Magallana gigas TaxID=29159 RepID=UPI00333F2743